MIKHTQTILGLLPTNCLSLFNHFVEVLNQSIDLQSKYMITASVTKELKG